MAIGEAGEKTLNTMCGGAAVVALGTAVKNLETSAAALGGASGLVKGVASASAAQATANVANITTGLATVTGWIAAVYRAGVDVTSDAVFSAQTGGVLRVADGTTFSVTENDKIQYIAW
jgi:hydrogenase/urease accessory protein HupE